MIRTKSIHSPGRPDDGLRILATRFRGRGVPKDRYDVWMANLGPSEALLRDFQAGRVRWGEFLRRYRAELWAGSDVDEHNAVIRNHGQKFTLRLLKELGRRGNLTLLCHCPEDERHCHRHELARQLRGKLA